MLQVMTRAAPALGLVLFTEATVVVTPSGVDPFFLSTGVLQWGWSRHVALEGMEREAADPPPWAACIPS